MAGDESTLRPDLIVSLPGGKHVVVDAKAPLQGVLDAYQARDEEERERHLRDHARLLRRHVKALADKAVLGGPGLGARHRRDVPARASICTAPRSRPTRR